MTKSLIVSKKNLEQHFQGQEAILTRAVSSKAHVALSADWTILPLVLGLEGSGCEAILRNRGGISRTVPLLLLRSYLWAWLGFREEWMGEKPAGKTQRYSFRSINLTVYFGFRNTNYKPQMFRAEWSGWSRWNGFNYGYQAENAGHPHWQFDAIESMLGEKSDDRAAHFLAILKSEAEGQDPQEFSPSSIEKDDMDDIVAMHKLSRIHFSSAAHLWKSPPKNIKAHAPNQLKDIQTWFSETLMYLQDELSRLK